MKIAVVLAIIALIIVIRKIKAKQKAKQKAKEEAAQREERYEQLVGKYKAFKKKSETESSKNASLSNEELLTKANAGDDFAAHDYIVRAFSEWESNGKTSDDPYWDLETLITRVAQTDFGFYEKYEYVRHLYADIVLARECKDDKKLLEKSNCLIEMNNFSDFLTEFPDDFLSDDDSALFSGMQRVISHSLSIAISYLALEAVENGNNNSLSKELLDEAKYIDDPILEVVTAFGKLQYNRNEYESETKKILGYKTVDELSQNEVISYNTSMKKQLDCMADDANDLYYKISYLSEEKKNPIDDWSIAGTVLMSFKSLATVFSLKKDEVISHYLVYEMHNLRECRDKIKLDEKYREEYDSCLD